MASQYGHGVYGQTGDTYDTFSQNVDADTASAVVTPSANDIAVLVDAATASATVSPSSSDSRLRDDPTTSSVTVTPSGTDVRTNVDAATASVTATPSSAENRLRDDPATASVVVTPSSIDIRVSVDATTASVTVSPVGAIRYVNLATGSDTAAGTTWSTAKATLSSAAATVSAGDEIRVAKTTDPAALSGTLTWTDGSTSVTTSTNLTGTLSVYDIIGPEADGSGGWWEISAISATQVTLSRSYSGSSDTQTSYKLPTFDIFPAAVGTVYDLAGGTSGNDGTADSPVTVIGGWNTVSGVRDGYTHVKNGVLSSTKRGVPTMARKFWLYGYLGFHRFPTSVTVPSTAVGTTIMYSSFSSWTTNAIHSSADLFSTALSMFTGGTGSGVTLADGSGQSVSGDMRSMSGSGVVVAGSTIKNVWIVGLSATRCLNAVLLTNASRGVRIEGCSFAESGNMSVLASVSIPDVSIVDCSMSGAPYYDISTSGLYEAYVSRCLLLSAAPFTSASLLRIDNHQQVEGDHRHYTSLGLIKSNTIDSRSGKAIEIQPTVSTSAYIERRFAMPLGSADDYDINVWLKRSSDFNGSVKVATRIKGLLTDEDMPELVTVSATNWNEFTFPVTMASAGVVELVVMVSGTVGSVFIDDITSGAS